MCLQAKGGRAMRITMTPTRMHDLMYDLLAEYPYQWVPKSKSAFMRTVADALDLMGILDHKDFMERYTTTIGDTIYAPFEWGEGDPDGLWNQVETLVHELTHVEQYHANPVLFPARYLADRSWRAQYEAEAFRADLQIHFWQTGEIYDIDSRAATLLGYGLSEAHCIYVAQYLASMAETIRDGGQVSPVATWVSGWLESELDR